jgi:xanthine dehydrogenase small subunit
VLSNGQSKRELPLRNFFKGYKKLDKQPDEHLETIFFDLPDEHTLFHFEKVSKRTYLDIASVNAAVQLKMDADIIEYAALSAGGVAPVPLYLAASSGHLVGKRLSAGLLAETLKIADSEIAPISDVRGTSDYKRLLLKQLIKAHFLTLFPALPVEQLITA